MLINILHIFEFRYTNEHFKYFTIFNVFVHYIDVNNVADFRSFFFVIIDSISNLLTISNDIVDLRYFGFLRSMRKGTFHGYLSEFLT